MRFLHISTFYPPYSFGGDAMYIYRLAHALGDQGHEVDVAHCVDSYQLLHPAPPHISFSEHPRVNRHELRSGLNGLGPLVAHQTGRPFLIAKQLRNLLAAKDYDVIHYHNISLLGPGVLRYSSPQNRAVKLYTTHEHWLVCPTHVLWKFDGAPCEKPECLKCVIAGKRPPQLWRHTGFLTKAAKHVDEFVSPSRFTARMHQDRGFPYPVGHLPYFLERCDQDNGLPVHRLQDRPYFLFVGRLEKIKGLHTLIEAWKKVKGCDLVIAGTGQEEVNLRAQASSNPAVRFLGPKTQKELGNLYAHAVACIVPSITYETFGVIIIEAFARKTPVIVRELGALSEMVQDSGGGLTYRTDEDLLKGVDQLVASPTLRNSLGKAGYEGYLRWWTREAHLEQYFGLIEGIKRRREDTNTRWQDISSPAVPASSVHT